MHELTIIEGQKAKLLTHLDKTFGVLGLMELADAAEALERVLEDYLKKVVEEFAPILFGCEKRQRAAHLIGPDGALYELSISPDIHNTTVLFVSLLPHPPSRQKPRQHTVSVGEYGKIQKIRLYVPPELKVDFDFLGDLAAALLGIGYTWMRSHIELLVAREEISVVDDLYREVRRLTPSENICSNLWFGCVTRGYGFRLLERSVTERSFDFIHTHADKYGYSTNRLVAELLSARLPSSGLLMQTAINLNRCIDGDMSQARYKKEGSVYTAALGSLYGEEAVSIYPVYRSEQISVLGLFPTQMRPGIEAFLNCHKADLVSAIEQALSRISKAFEVFDKSVKRRFSLDNLNEALVLKPQVFGVGVDVNKVVDIVRRKRSRS